jgi:hypothetical protein
MNRRKKQNKPTICFNNAASYKNSQFSPNKSARKILTNQSINFSEEDFTED